MADSPKYSLNAHDMKRAGQVLFHAVLVAIVVNILNLIPSMNLGNSSVVVMTIAVPLLQLFQRYLESPATVPTPVTPAV